MSKHTPGPWEIGRPNRPAFADNGIWAGGFVICDMCNDGYEYDEQKANARLIASAPELLEMLKALFDMPDERSFCDISNEEIHLWTRAQKLVDKVEGKQ